MKKKSSSSLSAQTDDVPEKCSSIRRLSFYLDEYHKKNHIAKSVHADKSSLIAKKVHTTKTFAT